MSIGIYITTIVILSIAAGIVILRQHMRVKQLEKLIDHTNDKLERLQLSFGKFTPEEVVEHLTDADGSYKPNMREVTVLFADLQGFTKMCAGMEAPEVLAVLNGYFLRMSEAITTHHGRVTELLGDGMLVLFGALKNNPWQVQDAVMAGIAMREALAKYNLELRAQSKPELSFGVGIHKGKVLAGVMGNFDLSKFGVVGDAINIAARVEGLTRTHGVDMLISEEVYSALDDRFELVEMPAELVKGKEEPIVTYFVKGFANALSPAGGGKLRKAEPGVES